MKICPSCKSEQKDSMHISCEKCRVPYVSEDQLLTHFTKDELKVIATHILKDWRVYVVAGIVLVAGIFVLNWGVGKKIEAQVNKLLVLSSNQISAAYSSATNQLAVKFQDFSEDASNQIASAYSSVTNQIADEFQTPKIKQTVETVAKNQAKEILTANVQPEVDRFRADADFLRLATRARAYDFKAYQQLLKLESLTNDNANFAKQILAEIDRSLEKDRSYNEQLGKHVFIQSDGTNSYNGPFTSDEIAVRFPIMPQNKFALNREGFINTASDFNQPLFMPFLIEFLTNEPDLSVADRVTVAISKLSDQDFHPHDFEKIQLWWQSHQSNFTNWPVQEYWNGISQFNGAEYQKAAKSFEQILHLDPTADSSRFFAIASCWEIGETNSALMLTKEFKNLDARWAKLANAKAELESGSVSNATLQLAFIATNFPTMLVLPKQGFHVWGKVDWDLFNSLTKTQKP